MDYDKVFRTKEDLVKHAKDRGVNAEGTRAEITARLVIQDEINAAAEADSQAAQAVATYDTPAQAPQAARSDNATAPENVIKTDTVKVKREAAPAEVVTGPISEELDGKVLVRMTKRASRHTIGNYRFSRQHPFCLVDKETATLLTDELTGFRRATAREAEAYYAND